MTVFEGEDILVVSPAPGVDALGVVTDSHNVVVRSEGVDDLGLEFIRILVFVDEDVFEFLGERFFDMGVKSEELEEGFEEVVVVEDLFGEFEIFVGKCKGGDFF